MKKLHISGIMMTTILIAGCGGAASDQKPKPGSYETTAEITALELAGMTEEQLAPAKSQMKNMLSAQTSVPQCLAGDTNKGWKEVPEQIAKSLGGNCETIKESGSPTNVDTEVSCKGTRMGDVVVKMTGAAEDESYGADINFELSNIPGASADKNTGKIGMKISAKRAGDC